MEQPFSSEKLIQLLEHIKTRINNNDLDLNFQQNLWSFLTEPVDKEMLGYLFKGWWITHNYESHKNT